LGIGVIALKGLVVSVAVVLMLIAVGALYAWIWPYFARKEVGQAPIDVAAVYRWPERGDYEFEVAGESFYQHALAKHARHIQPYEATEVVALLLPTNSNPHDPLAVEVRVEGDLVGHLSRDDARSFRRRLSSKGMSNATTACSARIVGGGARAGAQYFYGLELDIRPFD